MPPQESLATLAFRLRETTEGTPEREALLERIANAIRTGTYQVDAEVLADKLLRQLPGTKFRPEDQK